MTEFDQSLCYIQKYFLTLEAVATRADVSVDYITTLIEKKAIPASSYVVNSNTKINSSLNDEIFNSTVESYFPPSILNKLFELKSIKPDAETIATLEKEKFSSKFKWELMFSKNKEYAYSDKIWNAKGELNDEALDKVIDNEWNNYLKGIYGICTFDATVVQIIKKEISIARLKIFINTLQRIQLPVDKLKDIAKELINEYNLVSTYFAPYQRANVSRGKYADFLIERFNLNDVVDTFNYQESRK